MLPCRTTVSTIIMRLTFSTRFGGHIAEEGTLACMKQAYDLGINFFDTAEWYVLHHLCQKLTF